MIVIVTEMFEGFICPSVLPVVECYVFILFISLSGCDAAHVEQDKYFTTWMLNAGAKTLTWRTLLKSEGHSLIRRKLLKTAGKQHKKKTESHQIFTNMTDFLWNAFFLPEPETFVFSAEEKIWWEERVADAALRC